MIHPAPTSKVEPGVARGVLEAFHPASGTTSAHVVISFPNTNYQTHLVAIGPISAEPGKRIMGVVRAKARRVDVVQTGGRYIEPVYGRPRRVQGRVIESSPSRGCIVVDAAVAIHLELTDSRQSPADFQPGQLVSCDVLDGATFEQRA